MNMQARDTGIGDSPYLQVVRLGLLRSLDAKDPQGAKTSTHERLINRFHNPGPRDFVFPPLPSRSLVDAHPLPVWLTR